MVLLALLLALIMLAICNVLSGIDDVSVTIAILLFSLVYIASLMYKERSKKYLNLVLIAYLLKIAFLFYDVYTNNPLGLPMLGGPLTSDPYTFYHGALLYSQGIEVSEHYGYFSRLVGVIFRVTGASRLLGEFIVLLFSMGTIRVTIRNIENLDLSDSQITAGVAFISLLPNYILLSVVFLRETVITFFMALSLRYFIEWFKSGKDFKLVLAIGMVLIGSMFHGAVSTIAVGYIIIRLIYNPNETRFEITLKAILLTVFILIIFIFLFQNYETTFFKKFAGIDSISDISSGKGKGGSSYAAYVGNSANIFNFAIYTMPRMIYFMFSPFPWQWRGMADILTFLMSSLPYAITVINTINSLRKKQYVSANDKRKFIIS